MKNHRLLIVLALALPALAQWPEHRAPGTPLLPDGKANLSAPAPKNPDGTPDLTGVWQPGKSVVDIAKGLKPGDVSFTQWGASVYKQRVDTEGKTDPQAYCVLSGVPREDFVPYPFKILRTDKGMIVILYEALHSYRQIFMDGRQLPRDPNPTWMGYSVGHWDGDTLVVESAGFNDKGWLDNIGHPNTEAMHLTERFHRRDFGHIDLRITIDDPTAYTKPWTVDETLTLLPEGELIEYVCSEDEKDLQHLVGKK